METEKTFKNFLKEQWKDTFLKIWIALFGLVIFEIIRYQWCIDSIRNSTGFGIVAGYILIFMWPAILLLLTFKMIQFWSDFKNDRTR